MFGTKGVRGISERQIAQSAEKRCAQNLRLPDSRNPGQFCDYGRGLEYLSMPVKNQCCAAMDGSTSLNAPDGAFKIAHVPRPQPVSGILRYSYPRTTEQNSPGFRESGAAKALGHTFFRPSVINRSYAKSTFFH